MKNFNNYNTHTKDLLSSSLQDSSKAIGGVNFLLGLCENIIATSPHALTNTKCQIHSDKNSLKWKKALFQDKLQTLEEIFSTNKASQTLKFNIDKTSSKKAKRFTNLIRTLAPMEFVVSPKKREYGEGFTFKAFVDTTDESATLNPLFVALFFYSTDQIKKALKYTAQHKEE